MSRRQLQIQSAMDQAGHTVTLNIVVPEPGMLLVTALGLVWAVCLRSKVFTIKMGSPNRVRFPKAVAMVGGEGLEPPTFWV